MNTFCKEQGKDFTVLSDSNKIAKETIGAEVVWEVTSHSEPGKPTKFQDVLGKAQKVKKQSHAVLCHLTNPQYPRPEQILERHLGVEKFGEDDWRFNKWYGFCVKTNKTSGLAKNVFYSVLLLMAKAGSMCPVSFGMLALLVKNYWFV